MSLGWLHTGTVIEHMCTIQLTVGLEIQIIQYFKLQDCYGGWK
jgi:hypothetical protein